MAAYNVSTLYEFDSNCEKEFNAGVIGIDEAGRGPLAGPVVAAAVVLDLKQPIDGVNDSKKVAPQKRAELYDVICSRARAWAVGQASVEEIDRHNILQATFLAMRRALDKIDPEGLIVLVDGNQYIPTVSCELQKPVIRGDGLSASIAAASILAKVTRDRIMEEYQKRYSKWDFGVHKGYGTARHCELIGKFGLCDIHRKSFCKRFIKG